jgi:phage terminase large subunit-like protein
MYLNQVWQPEGNLYSSAEWKRIEREGVVLEPGDTICLGFDGGKTDDATALVAVRVKDALIVPLLVEERPEGWEGRWEVNYEKVDSMIHWCFREYNVVGFYADVALWESYIHEWTLDYGDRLIARAGERGPIALDMRGSRKKMASLHESFMSAILNKKVFHGGAPDLAASLKRHVLNAVRRDTPYGVSFMKESPESKRKVDLYAAAMLAFSAFQEYLLEVNIGANKDKDSSKRVYRW